jgi:hypothetical protein
VDAAQEGDDHGAVGGQTQRHPGLQVRIDQPQQQGADDEGMSPAWPYWRARRGGSAGMGGAAWCTTPEGLVAFMGRHCGGSGPSLAVV